MKLGFSRETQSCGEFVYPQSQSLIERLCKKIIVRCEKVEGEVLRLIDQDSVSKEVLNKYIEIKEILDTIKDVSSTVPISTDSRDNAPNLFLLCQLFKEQLLQSCKVNSIHFCNPHKMQKTFAHIPVERFLLMMNYFIHTWQTSYSYAILDKISFMSLDLKGRWQMEFNFNYLLKRPGFITYIKKITTQREIIEVIFKENSKIISSLLDASNAEIKVDVIGGIQVVISLIFKSSNQEIGLRTLEKERVLLDRINEDTIAHKKTSVLLSLIDDKSLNLSFIKKDWEKLNGIDIVILQKLVKEVYDHIDHSSYNIKDLAESMGMGRTSLFHKIKSITGLTPNDFILNMRLEKAKILLEKRVDMQVSEIAYCVGFSSPCYFSRSFKSHCGVSPKVFREQLG
ncbi:helix-turn-helix transcriptional regulator [Halosquirtibacter xylanolyticus]|uniref:helix-turn-helix domain-containing protein n=1 Tax=Halosquirtibacter xylanolyticus TaxID=3374599 RepID=UPI00374955BA|nr:helix-turn-helix transcriptional regulator [Prolixibacteraceae bacterium]